jgi:glycosyltransferase involved in cell wall biosynthesis
VSHLPTRIAFCITDLDPGGAEWALVQLAAGLDRAEWDPRVYCLGPPGALVDRLAEAGIGVECLGARSARNVGVIIRLARRLRAFRPALLQTFLFHANLAGRIAGRLARVPVVVCGIRVAERERRWHLLLDRWTQRLVTHNVCVSRAVADFSIARGRLHPDKLSVIPNGVDCERFAQAIPADLAEFGIPRGTRTILSVGRLHPQKGHDLLISAVAPLLAERPNLHVLIVGEGPSRERLQSQIVELGCREQVHLAGWRSDIPEIMKACTIFTLPSRWEGMPNVVLEAMAASLPVVATDVEGVHELIRNGVNGIVVRGDSAADFRSGLQALLDDPAMQNRFRSEAQTHVAKAFATHNMLARYHALYRELLVGGHSLNT